MKGEVVDSAERPTSGIRTLRKIITYGLASIGLSVLATISPAVSQTIRPDHQPVALVTALVAMVLLAFTLGLVSPFVIAFRAVRDSLQERAPAQALLVIFVSYVTLIVVFASLFVAMSSIGDYNDAVSKLFFYQGVRDEGLLSELPESWQQL